MDGHEAARRALVATGLPEAGQTLNVHVRAADGSCGGCSARWSLEHTATVLRQLLLGSEVWS